jgi:hypothetical protein
MRGMRMWRVHLTCTYKMCETRWGPARNVRVRRNRVKTWHTLIISVFLDWNTSGLGSRMGNWVQWDWLVGWVRLGWVRLLEGVT